MLGREGKMQRTPKAILSQLFYNGTSADETCLKRRWPFFNECIDMKSKDNDYKAETPRFTEGPSEDVFFSRLLVEKALDIGVIEAALEEYDVAKNVNRQARAIIIGALRNNPFCDYPRISLN